MASFAFPATCKVASNASSTLLITASAGFGAYYAASQGAGHGPILGGLFVVMALGLELAKPFSITAAINALRRWQPVQAALLALLGLVAIAYSLSAELSLMAAMRSDLVAKRSAENDAAAKAADRYQEAKAELSGTRPAPELQSLIDTALANPKLRGCAKPEGAGARQQCAQVAEWKTQQRRRVELEAAMTDAEHQTGAVLKLADPAASALVVYLAIFGFHVPPELLTELLILVGVLALEVGSALSMVLVRAVSEAVPLRVINAVPRPMERAPEPVQEIVNQEHAEKTGRLGTALLSQLKSSRDGSLKIGQRGLARLNCSLAETNRTIHSLAKAGAINVSVDRLRGTALTLPNA